MTTNEIGNKYAGPNQEFAVFAALRGSGYRAHIYDGGRCVFCELQELDDYLDDPHHCVDRGAYGYSTVTPPDGTAATDRKKHLLDYDERTGIDAV